MPRTPGGTLSGFTLLSTPNAPTITGVTTSIGSASVAFTAPSNTGDGAITSYVVTAVDESSGVSTGFSGASSPITISPGGGTFKIRMQALNPYGPGRLTEYDTGNVIYNGELYTWGANTVGEVGDNTVINRSSPVQIGSLTNWAKVTTANNHSLAIKTDSTLWSWGRNNLGQLGVNDLSNRSSPVQIGALTSWNFISSGGVASFAVKNDGSLWAWGQNTSGQLGDNTIVQRSSPVQIGSLTNWAKVATGSYNTSAVKTDGTLWAWGPGGYGAVGDGTYGVYRSSPVQIGMLTTWYSVSRGRRHACATKTDGTFWAWGFNNRGQLGQNNVIARSSPVQVGALTNWNEPGLIGAIDSSIAVKSDGTLWAWGYNGSGQLGDNTTTYRSSPVQIGALTNWSQAIVGAVSLAVKTDGTLWSWGVGTAALGQSSAVSKSSPVQVGALTNWVSVSSFNNHTAALLGVV